MQLPFTTELNHKIGTYGANITILPHPSVAPFLLFVCLNFCLFVLFVLFHPHFITDWRCICFWNESWNQSRDEWKESFADLFNDPPNQAEALLRHSCDARHWRSSIGCIRLQVSQEQPRGYWHVTRFLTMHNFSWGHCDPTDGQISNSRLPNERHCPSINIALGSL